jgi:hypothetical protein
MQSGVNYITLATSYAGFLTALGGVSITVLTLVLALEREPSDLEDHSGRDSPPAPSGFRSLIRSCGANP